MAPIQNFYYFPLPPPHNTPSPPNVAPPHNTPNPPKVAPPHNIPSPPNVVPPHNTPSPPNIAPPHNTPPPSNIAPSHNTPSPPSVPPSNTPPPKVAPPHNPNKSTPPSPVPAAPEPPAAKPPSHSSSPPSPIVRPPPHPLPPPPPLHPLPPPLPPHILPPPPPATPGHHSTVIVIVFVSLGGLFFLAFLSVALCCFIQKKRKRMVKKTEIISLDKHVKVQEAMIQGPHCEQAMMLTIEEDVHIEEEIKKNDILHGGSHTKPSQNHLQAFDVAESSLGSSHHHLEHKA